LWHVKTEVLNMMDINFTCQRVKVHMIKYNNKMQYAMEYLNSVNALLLRLSLGTCLHLNYTTAVQQRLLTFEKVVTVSSLKVTQIPIRNAHIPCTNSSLSSCSFEPACETYHSHQQYVHRKVHPRRGHEGQQGE